MEEVFATCHKKRQKLAQLEGDLGQVDQSLYLDSHLLFVFPVFSVAVIGQYISVSFELLFYHHQTKIIMSANV